MRPIPPPGPTRNEPVSRDEAGRGAYSLAALEDLLDDCQAQPDWRQRADHAHAFYDMGKQLTPEREHQIRRNWGIEPRQTNLVFGVINGVLGQEAKARSDVRIEADDDDFADVSDVLSVRMKEAQREANVDMAVSNGYAGQVKGGIGWVEVSRAADPLDYPYRVREIHRNQIWYDWRSTDLGLRDAMWLVRKRWEDLNEAVALMPQFEQILMGAVNGFDMLNLPDDDTNENVVVLRNAWNLQRTTRIVRDDWCDTRRKRIKFHEVWYRVPAEVVVLQLSPTKRVMFDRANPLHIEAVRRGLMPVSKAITRQVRMALFAGPHRLMDVGTPRRNFPYVPFFAFRDDEDRSPYGLIEGMISPQEEYNERRQMVNWMLKARQIQLDSDALDKDYNTVRNLQSRAMRQDTMIVLDPNRMNKQKGVEFANNFQVQAEQVEIMQDAKQLIQDVPKVYSSQLGNAPAGVTSGIANSLLIEQGLVAMGELNDNYRYARKMVHEQLLDLIVDDHLQEKMRVMIGTGTQRRAIVLNVWGPQGEPINRVKDAPIRVGLSEVPVSPAYRMQEQQQLATIIQGLQGNPQAMAILAPAYIEGSSLPNRQGLADDLRRASGIPVAADRQAQAAAQQQTMQAAQEGQALEKAGAVADINKKVAETQKTQVETAKLAHDAQINAGNQALAERKQAVAETPPAGAPGQPAANEGQLIERSLAQARA